MSCVNMKLARKFCHFDQFRIKWIVLTCFVGLSMTWTVSTSVFLIMAFSYFRILNTGVRHNRTGINMKALRTCATHLIVYVVYEVVALVIIVSLRFPSLSPDIKKLCSILFIIVPPAINPIIYGLISKELRASIIKQFSMRISLK